MKLITTNPRITTDAGGPQLKIRIGAAPSGKVAVCKHPKDRKPGLEVRSGSSVVKIFGHKGPGPYTIAWREGAGGKRLRAMRSKLATAKSFAEDKAKVLANGELTMLDFGHTDRASYKRALELLQPTGKSLEMAVAEYAEAVQKLGTMTLAEAIQFVLQHRPAGAVTKTCPQIADELMAFKRTKKRFGSRWARTLQGQLDAFTKHFNCPLQVIRAPQINAWLQELNVKSEDTRANYRGAVVALVNFAMKRGYLSPEWRELNQVEAPEKSDVDIKILTPEQLTRLLSKARPNLIPFIALTAFAGIRNEEMSGEKALLDWRDIHLEKKVIYVPNGVGKTGTNRIVPICDNLLAWLVPYARRNGPVCALAGASDALCSTKKRAGIPAGKNETRNTLRKSYISYRLAIVKNRAQVAEEAGNSPAKIKSNYNKPIPEAEAKRWFEIWPSSADILQPEFGFASK